MHPHAVTSVYNVGGAQCGVGSPWMTLAYDLNGNLQSQTVGAVTTTYTFDAENRYKSRTASGSTTTYSYNAHGTEVKRSKSDGTWTVYIEGLYEKTNTGAIKKYYPAYGRNIVMRDVPSGAGAGTLYYLLADHLGGTAELLDSAGATVANSETKYWPYGATRQGGVTPTDKLFTGQRQEPGDTLGLYNYNARFYSTTLGRFVSVDPIVGSDTNPQAWNAYAYVRNNPLKYVDPAGLDPCEALCQGLQAVSALLGAGYTASQIGNIGLCGALMCAPVLTGRDDIPVVYVPFHPCGEENMCIGFSLSSALHVLLDVGGFVMPLADGLNALIYLLEGDYQNAGISSVAILPVGGDAFKGFKVAKLTKLSSRLLARNLEKQGLSRPLGAAAHHIVAGSDHRAAEARAVLERFDIDINSAENGVFLINHPRVHRESYYTSLSSALSQATTRNEAIDVLNYVRAALRSGAYP